MLKTKVHIAIMGILATTVSCANESDNAVFPESEKNPEGTPTTIYANEYGEIHLSEINDSIMYTVFYNNDHMVFDTILKIDHHFSLIPFDGNPFLQFRTGGIKIRENRLEIYDFAGPAYMAMYIDIEKIYERPFYKLNDTITINDVISHQKGGEIIQGIYVIPQSDLNNEFVSIRGVITKEKYPREYYSTSDSPQGMFSDTTKNYFRLVIKPVTVNTPPRNTFTGRTLNNNGQACFAWDFADSEIFYLDGHRPWTEEELDMKLTIDAVLIQFEDGKSLLKNWQIID